MADIGANAVDELILSIYAAVREPVEWPALLERIRLALSADDASLTYSEKSTFGTVVVRPSSLSKRGFRSRPKDFGVFDKSDGERHIAIRLPMPPSAFAVMNFVRDDAPFDRVSRDVLARLVPHLEMAATMSVTLHSHSAVTV